jgi:glycyl-tRNA synthetase
MENIYEANGIPFWSEEEIALRNYYIDHFARTIRNGLLETNPAWQMTRIEAPLLTPCDLLNKNYQNSDIWIQEGQEERKLALRPETTPGSYAYAQHLLKSSTGKPPLVVWQAGKSFRREQDQVTKNMRLKEFYQQEFQCIFSDDSFNDYHASMLEPVRSMLEKAIGKAATIVVSDRLPDYSLKTMDVEIAGMEVCSISLRKDFPDKFVIVKKSGEKSERTLLVLEIAIGLDRCVYQHS